MIHAVDYLKIKVNDKLSPLPLPNGTDISQWEQKNGYKLPMSFKEALAAWSGKHPMNLEIELSDGTKLGFCCLYHVYDDLDNHQSYLLDIESIEDLGFGSDLVEFSSSGQYYYCLDFSERDDSPPVVLVDSSKAASSPEAKAVLASTFDEFLTKYTVPPDQAPT